MDEINLKLLAQVGKGIALKPEPFNEIARELGITQKEIIERLTLLKEEGVIRKFGATIKPNTVGFSANALVAWKVPADRIREVGTQLSKLTDISHCNERKPVQGRWEFNLYIVMHATERVAIERMVKQISVMMELNEYKILYSTRDLKRTKLCHGCSDELQTKTSVMSPKSPQEVDQI